MRILILHNAVAADAAPDERDVLDQVAAIAASLARLGHEPAALGCDLDLPDLGRNLQDAAPDLVFNLVESLGGEGRLIHVVPALLDALGVRYAGCPSEAMFTTSHKVLAKQLLVGAGLPTPVWYELRRGRLVASGGGVATPARCLVKSVWEDASLGMDDDAVVAADPESLVAALGARAGRPGSPWFAEAFVDGREFNLSVLDGPGGPQVLPPAELTFVDYPPDKPRIVGYAAKWDEDSFEYSHTVRTFDLAPADAPLLARLREQSLACWDLFGLRGWARVDFRVDAAGEPWILEANANPCLSADAGFQAAVARAGLTFDDAVARILAAVPGA
ncbi:MAG: D-alanine--D-alanine ligase [bacterium]|nr:D-alanine--D-alanine ligase [bacterium]